MWIILRVIVAVVFLAAIEFYFIRKSKKTLLRLFPSLTQKKLKIFVLGFLTGINLYPVILISGMIYAAITKQSPSVPEGWLLDYFLIYPFWILFILIFQMIVYYLVLDLIKVVLYPVFKRHKERFLRYEAVAAAFLLGFFILYVPARIIYDYRSVETNEIIFLSRDLPPELEGFRLVFISDVQADRHTNDERLENFIDRVNQADPDIVLVAGDIITSGPDYINRAAEYIGKIKSEYGIYSCVGDHDNWAYRQDNQRSIKEITGALQKYGVEMVDNGVRKIPVGDSYIGITFITNTYVEEISPQLLGELSGSNSTDLKIFLTHQPKINLIRSASENNYDIFLAGHTHGGQITLLFPFIQLTPTLVETTFIRGQRYYGNMLAVVTRGLGMSLAPIRYNSTPEIVVIRLSKK